MTGRWAGSTRRSRLPSNWPQLCGQVHARSKSRCEFLVPAGHPCGRPADGGVDHIIRGDDHRLENLRDTCSGHHGKKSSEEGNAAKAANKRRRKIVDQHPGRRQWT